MKVHVHPGEYIYVYEDTGGGYPLSLSLVLVLGVYASALVVSDHYSHNGVARISSRMSSDEKAEYLYEYTDKNYKSVSRHIARLENKDRVPLKTWLFIQNE